MERNNIKLVVASGPSFIHLAKRLRIPITPDPSAVRNRMKHCDRPSRCAVYMMYTKCFLIAVCQIIPNKIAPMFILAQSCG